MKKSRGRICLCLTLLILTLLFIWGNSLLPGTISGAFSEWIQSVLQKLFPNLFLGGIDAGHGLLRKLAHFSEFAMLGLWLGWLQAMLQTVRWKQWALPLLAGFLAACTDETIQLFVPGRHGSFIDVGIDTLGVTLGIVFITLIQYFIMYKKLKENKQ